MELMQACMKELWACELGKEEESSFYRLRSEMSHGPTMKNYEVIDNAVVVIC
jgi:hypothetical protein